MRSQLFDQVNMQQPTTERWSLQSSKMLRVGLGPDVLAAKGAMVAYTGQLTFAHEGAGAWAAWCGGWSARTTPR